MRARPTASSCQHVTGRRRYRLAALVPPPRKHRHRYHGVFAPNHKLRSAVTALAIANVGKPRDAATDGHAVGGHAACGDTTADCCDSCDKPPSHDTSRIAWAKLMARVGEEFPLECPGCGGDIRLIALHPSRGRSLRRPPAGAGSLRTGGSQAGEGQDGFARVKKHRHQSLLPVARPPTGESSSRSTFDRAIFQASPDELPDIDIHSL